MQIRQWVEDTFRDPGPKLFLELGAHRGEDTQWLAAIPGVTLHAVEPDPRNVFVPPPNVTLHQMAIAAQDGTCRFIPQRGGKAASGSIHAPTGHLKKWPKRRFGDWIAVACATLDTFCDSHGIGVIDFIWADIQGAEGDMIMGGQRTLGRTRFLYTEVCPDGSRWYAGQPCYSDLLAMLPRWWVLHRWEHEVLLERMLG